MHTIPYHISAIKYLVLDYPGKVSITLDNVPLEDHIVFSANYTQNDLTLSCLGTVGHGQLMWMTTIAGFREILQISTPNFTIVDNDINVTLTIINYRHFDGTFICQSLQSGQEFHVHLQEGNLNSSVL